MTRFRHFVLFAATLLVASACSDRSLDDDPTRDSKAPAITIETPQRGTIVPDNEITVEGKVTDLDSNVTEVTVNGIPANVQADGSFRAIISVGSGVTLLKTVAIDEDGNAGTDTRGVLAGNLVPEDTRDRDAIVANIDRQTFAEIGVAVENMVLGNQIEDMLVKNNPVMDKGSDCNGVSLDVTKVETDDAIVDLTPVEGGIAFSIDLDRPYVELTTNFALACADGSAGVYINADRFTASGLITVDVHSGKFELEMPELESAFEELDIDVGYLKSEVIEMIIRDLDGVVAKALVAVIRSTFEGFVEDVIGEMNAGEWEIDIVGAKINFGIFPTIADFSEAGAFIAADGNVQAVDGTTVGYLSTPTPPPSFAGQTGFKGAVSDDFINQAFGAFFASGAAEKAIAYDNQTGESGNLLGINIDQVQVTLLLPPVVNATDMDGIQITIADLLVDIIEKGPVENQIVTRLAISGEIVMAIHVDEATQRLRFATENPKLYVDVLDDGVNGANPLGNEQVEVLASFVATRMAGAMDDLIGNIPLPAFGGAKITAPDFAPDSGYMVVAGSIRTE